DAGAVGHEQALVRVEGDGVGVLDAGECGAAAFGELEAAAVGGVDVVPEVLVAGEVGQGRQRVDGAGAGGAGGAGQEEGAQAGGAVGGDEAGGGVGVHAQVGCGGYGADGGG